MRTRRSSNAGKAAVHAAVMVLLLCLTPHDAHAQPCGAGVASPQCDGQCALGQMCADLGSGCTCVPAVAACGGPGNPNGPPVCWGACPSASMVCATFAGGCMCLQGPNLCGNGTLDPGEGCEDGNTVSGDGCDANCTPTACGNGIATAGEECDGNDAAACAAGCRPDCTCAAGPPTSTEVRCFLAIAKQAGKFVQAGIKLLQACRAQELASPGSCPMPDPAAVARLDQKLAAGLAKQCNLPATAFDDMGFPGRCTDANPTDRFTSADLVDCIRNSHTAVLAGLLAVEVDPTISGPLTDPTLVRCQSALGEAGAEVLVTTLKSVQKCRNAILKGKLTGVAPANCATADPKTAAQIAKTTTKAASMITAACDDTTVAALKACTPDQTTAGLAGTCIVATHVNAVDDPNPADPADLLDYEYATEPVCGDHVVNQAAEECDGPDDALCPGLCAADCTCP